MEQLVTFLATLAVVIQASLPVTKPVTLPPLPPDPCAGVTLVDSVDKASPSAKIVCLKPLQKELQGQLEKIGGYPKRLVEP